MSSVMKAMSPTNSIATHLVSQRWPATHPDRIQLYSYPTSNGVKISIMLEELGLPYEAHFVDLTRSETWMPQFLSLNPNGKIPAIIDPNGPEGRPLALFESGAILLYLADKTGRLLPTSPNERYEAIQWMFFQMANVGPMFGQFGYFYKFAGREIEDKRPLERYRAETQRLRGVVEERLQGRPWIMGEHYTIADIALIGWIRSINVSLNAGAIVQFDTLKNVPEWLGRCLERPAVQRGLNVPPRP
jgi:GSH-dependent disulfide-bond oxidoreductase